MARADPRSSHFCNRSRCRLYLPTTIASAASRRFTSPVEFATPLLNATSAHRSPRSAEPRKLQAQSTSVTSFAKGCCRTASRVSCVERVGTGPSVPAIEWQADHVAHVGPCATPHPLPIGSSLRTRAIAGSPLDMVNSKQSWKPSTSSGLHVVEVVELHFAPTICRPVASSTQKHRGPSNRVPWQSQRSIAPWHSSPQASRPTFLLLVQHVLELYLPAIFLHSAKCHHLPFRALRPSDRLGMCPKVHSMLVLLRGASLQVDARSLLRTLVPI